MSSSSISKPRPAEAIERAAVLTQGQPAAIRGALERLEHCAKAAGVRLVDGGEEPDIVVALGGDGTMLQGLRAQRGTGTPVFGINFGRVGFLTSAEAGELEPALASVFAGDYRVVELATLAAEAQGEAESAVNDVVVTSSRPGRMVELGWRLGGEDLGVQPCDGMICATASGSTAYNLSNGGPVMVWGLEAMAITFVAAHSLHARPFVVPRGLELELTNRSASGAATMLVDGRPVCDLDEGASVRVGVGDESTHLALLSDVTFFTRYHRVFT